MIRILKNCPKSRESTSNPGTRGSCTVFGKTFFVGYNPRMSMSKDQ